MREASAKSVDVYVPSVRNRLRSTLQEVQPNQPWKQDKKADWPSHLAEIAHAYNATQSAVTGYSPHYLMFG